MKPSFRPATSDRNGRSGTSAIVLSIVLVAITFAAFANNIIGGLGLLAAPFWLPLCCYFVPLYLVKIYFGISVFCLMLSLPLALTGDSLPLPEHFVFAFGLGSLMITIGSSLGLLVAFSAQNRVPPDER